MDLISIVTSIAADIVAFRALAQVLAVGIGIFYCGSALQKAIKKSASPGTDISGQSIFASFFIGALIVNFSGVMDSTLGSMGQSDTTYGDVISYANLAQTGAFAPAITAILTIISTFGWWYALKGWTMLRKASSGGGGGGYEDYAWKGFIHILGGAALVNINGTLAAFQGTLGINPLF
ncbi:conjugal transfer protein TraQ [Trinickia fusca]|uniref:Type IV secretion protein IcmC n=1 Tax=Trinickia fusca TaxID=2419777 RepID=A0A494XD51_9BURK|nr:conjugal transfer protein TraQ [Trinickia fusca]RKP47581.1 hypothetical protein D7S89_15250 [Trinickia fusca]